MYNEEAKAYCGCDTSRNSPCKNVSSLHKKTAVQIIRSHKTRNSV